MLLPLYLPVPVLHSPYESYVILVIQVCCLQGDVLLGLLPASASIV